MSDKIKKRLKNIAVWIYTIANAVLIAGATISFLSGNEVVGYIMAGAEVVVTVLASVNNPDFKGMIADKEYIVNNVEEAAKTANQIVEAVEKAKEKLGN